MIEFKINDEIITTNTGIIALPTAVTPISWERIPHGHGTSFMHNPHLLFITFDNEDPSYPVILNKKLVPLEQGKTFLPFHRGGKQSIKAFIVSGPSVGAVRKATKSTEIFFDDWEEVWITGLQHTVEMCTTMEVTEFDVGVPFDQFAQEMPEWLAFYVNFRRDTKATDHCSQWRRVITTIFFKMPLMFLYAITIHPLMCIVIALGAWGLGFRKVSLSPILHPFTQSPIYVTSQCGWHDNWLANKGPALGVDCNGVENRPLGILLSPFVLFSFGLCLATAMSIADIDQLYSTKQYIYIGFGIGALGVFLISILLVIASYAMQIYEKMNTELLCRKHDKEETAREAYLSQAEFSKPKFSFILLYEELKSRVCKPLPK